MTAYLFCTPQWCPIFSLFSFFMKHVLFMYLEMNAEYSFDLGFQELLEELLGPYLKFLIVMATFHMLYLARYFCALQMFCLQKSQMFICDPNSKTNTSWFYRYLCVIDYKYFHVVFKLVQLLNLQRNNYFVLVLQIFVCDFGKYFS